MSADWLLRCNVAKGTFEARGAEPIAGVAWNETDRRLELTRDPTGERPLFHTRTADGDLVASTSLERLLAEPGVATELARETGAAWLAGAPIAPDETLLAGIKRVPAGHILELTPAGETTRRWWSQPAPGTLPATDADRFGELLEAAVERATDSRRSCVFLSGGIDSGAVAAAAAAVTRRTGAPAPLALCVIFPGASEVTVQRQFARAADLELLEASVVVEGLAERALDRVATSTWPTAAPWAPIFDDLAGQAQTQGAEVLLDGQGGDELLDAGYEAGRLLVRTSLGLYDWLRAERTYTGGLRRSLKILARDLAGRLDPPVAPAWLADDLQQAVRARFATRPHGYAATRAADVLDGTLAAQREETYERGTRTGLAQRHPLWDPEVVALLDGLHPSALVAGGDPKAPARRYLRGRVPTVVGRWPKPQVADLASAQIGVDLRRLLGEQGGLTQLQRLAIVQPDVQQESLPISHLWRTMALESWIRGMLVGGRDR